MTRKVSCMSLFCNSAPMQVARIPSAAAALCE